MNNKIVMAVTLLLVSLLSGCEIIGGIFKAGAYVGILAVLIVLGLIFWIISKVGGGKS